MYDPRTGRFTQTDKISANRPTEHYTYGTNDPIRATDPSGNITIIVHGTYAEKQTWWRPTGGFAKSVDKETGDVWKLSTKSGGAVKPFSWSGGNSPKDREQGAKALKEYIDQIKKDNPNEPIRIVAHSHGGNVAKRATALGADVDAMALVGTPQGENRDKKAGDPARYLYAPDPTKIKRPVLNVYSDQDDIQNYWATTVHGGEEGSVSYGRTDQNPKMRGRYQNKSINTNTRLQKDAHSALHSESMGTAIGQWLEGREAKYPPVILDDDGTGK